jgi:hypothetical protein
MGSPASGPMMVGATLAEGGMIDACWESAAGSSCERTDAVVATMAMNTSGNVFMS